MKKATLQLETLTCPSCLAKIDGALKRLDGVEKAKVLFNSSKVKAKYDESLLSAQDIADTIENLGYKVLTVKSS